jgi:galactose mutarotase-like enzyme
MPDVRTLTAGPLVARWVPDVGMVGASLRHAGYELLGQRGGLDAYMSRGSSFGIPLLHPWANRLGGFAYRAAGVDVALDGASPRVRTEEHGLPIHGLMAAYRGWRVTAASENVLAAELDFAADDELLRAFPFPHRLELEVALEPERLTVTTTLTPTGDRAVPVAFGFHPYLALPKVERADWVLRVPELVRVVLDDHGLPTDAREPAPARDGALGDTVYDDLYEGAGDGFAATLSGAGRELTLRFLEGYTHVQLFAPPGQALVAIEPMTAPTDALRTGDGLRTVTAPFRAAFAIEVREVE